MKSLLSFQVAFVVFETNHFSIQRKHRAREWGKKADQSNLHNYPLNGAQREQKLQHENHYIYRAAPCTRKGEKSDSCVQFV